MIPGPRNGRGLLLADTVSRPALEVDLSTGTATGFGGLRRLLDALAAAGARFGELPTRHPAEWGWLTRPDARNLAVLARLARPASERRLRRECEQTFRVLAVAAAAVCRGAESLGVPVLLHGVGRADLPSLCGVVRAVEYAAATGIGRLRVSPRDAVLVAPLRSAAADTRVERARCLRALGFDVAATELRVLPWPAPRRPAPEDPYGVPEEALFAAALAPSGTTVDRIGAALAYCRLAFLSSNWEGIAVVASGCLPLAARLTARDVARMAAAWPSGADAYPADVFGADARGADLEEDEAPVGGLGATGFEPPTLRHPGDLHAHFLKLLGVQASFRRQHTDALGYFRAMREVDGPLSAETLAQSHLYAGVTLAKRQDLLPEAVAEVTAGFAALPARAAEPASTRRERGWLHNLRGYTHFVQGALAAALEQERAAFGCIDGCTDARSVQLRIDLVSNVSVLQESAGRLDQALQTWEWLAVDDVPVTASFGTHHSYRAGGLQVRAGDVENALPRLDESLRRCVGAADDFHEFEIAAELGALLLGRGRRVASAELFDRAALAATRLGDPYRMAVAAVGGAASRGVRVDEHTAGLARLSGTQSRRAQALVEGCRQGADPICLLPHVRTMLDRPFDLIDV
ncbi:MAG TPA: hypothetical protein VI248_08120 [Kineosporiaceae bacterium]